MVAYSFKGIFAPAIAAGYKKGTVRAMRKRHARPGEAIQLYTGMRTKQCRKIRPDVTCAVVHRIEIMVSSMIDASIVSIAIDDIPLNAQDIEAFAANDGFAPSYFNGHGFGGEGSARANMGRFWLQNHGEGRLEGVWIRWRT